MKYASPFLLNGGLAALAAVWISQSGSYGSLFALLIVLCIGFVLNIVLACIYFARQDLRIGCLYLAAVLLIVYVFNSANSHHGKMVNG
jgi:hypothetical protein